MVGLGSEDLGNVGVVITVCCCSVSGVQVPKAMGVQWWVPLEEGSDGYCGDVVGRQVFVERMCSLPGFLGRVFGCGRG